MRDDEKVLRQRLAIIYQQLEVFRQYPEAFEKALGKKGVEQWLNRTLDEAVSLRKRLQQFNN